MTYIMTVTGLISSITRSFVRSSKPVRSFDPLQRAACSTLPVVTTKSHRSGVVSFLEARELVRAQKLRSLSEYWVWSKTKRPRYIPSSPWRYYKKAWTNWPDYLGNKAERSAQRIAVRMAKGPCFARGELGGRTASASAGIQSLLDQLSGYPALDIRRMPTKSSVNLLYRRRDTDVRCPQALWSPLQVRSIKGPRNDLSADSRRYSFVLNPRLEQHKIPIVCICRSDHKMFLVSERECTMSSLRFKVDDAVTPLELFEALVSLWDSNSQTKMTEHEWYHTATNACNRKHHLLVQKVVQTFYRQRELHATRHNDDILGGGTYAVGKNLHNSVTVLHRVAYTVSSKIAYRAHVRVARNGKLFPILWTAAPDYLAILVPNSEGTDVVGMFLFPKGDYS